MFRASSCPSSGAQLTAVAASGLPLDRGGSSAVWSWSDRSARPRPTALLPPRSNSKPEAATAVIELLMMGMRMPETCWAVFKRQVINLRNCCIWLVDSFEWMTGFMTSAIAGTHSCQLLSVGPSDGHSWPEESQHTKRALTFDWNIAGTKLRLPGIFRLSWNFWHSTDGRTSCEIRGSHSGFVVGYYVVPSDT